MGKKRPDPEQGQPADAAPSVVKPDWEGDAERILRAPAKPAPARPRNPFKSRDSRRKR